MPLHIPVMFLSTWRRDRIWQAARIRSAHVPRSPERLPIPAIAAAKGPEQRLCIARNRDPENRCSLTRSEALPRSD